MLSTIVSTFAIWAVFATPDALAIAAFFALKAIRRRAKSQQ